VNQQLGTWKPQSCGRFSSSDISKAYYVPPHAHGQYVNYQQFQYGNSQPWMSLGSEQPTLSMGEYPHLEKPASNNPPLVNPADSVPSFHFHYHQHTGRAWGYVPYMLFMDITKDSPANEARELASVLYLSELSLLFFDEAITV
jgi:hypothetical protein